MWLYNLMSVCALSRNRTQGPAIKKTAGSTFKTLSTFERCKRGESRVTFEIHGDNGNAFNKKGNEHKLNRRSQNGESQIRKQLVIGEPDPKTTCNVELEIAMKGTESEVIMRQREMLGESREETNAKASVIDLWVETSVRGAASVVAWEAKGAGRLTWDAGGCNGVREGVMECGRVWWSAGGCGGVREGVVECGRVWWSAGGCGGVREGVVECGRVWWSAGGCGGVREGVVECGRVWWSAGGCGGVREGVVECGRVWWSAGGCGGVREGVVECGRCGRGEGEDVVSNIRKSYRAAHLGHGGVQNVAICALEMPMVDAVGHNGA
ncbi:hypothetical protein F5887DRAFT_1165689 [Amanita rubescens]|nr:hypothetical protein F5887DRAFT_1165689 [Amanita rubescens]